jgi:hypothetical protein
MTTSDATARESFSLEGIMVAGHPGQVRLVIDQIVVDLDEEDVVAAVEVVPSPPGLKEKVAQPVRLELRRGARLLGAGSAAAYADVLWERGHLFALRTRRAEPPVLFSATYRQLERDFFARYGIILPGDPEAEP